MFNKTCNLRDNHIQYILGENGTATKRYLLRKHSMSNYFKMEDCKMSNSAKTSAGKRIEALLDDNSFVEVGSYVTARSTDST